MFIHVAFPLPPLPEQQRIVAKVDTLMQLCDQLEEKISLLGGALDKLKQAILQLAVEGKLVPQDSNDQPASQLLKEIYKEKQRLIKTGKIRKSKLLPPVTDEEKPFDIPGSWEWVRLGEVGYINPRNQCPDHLSVGFIRMAEVPVVFGTRVDYEERKWRAVKQGYTHFAEGDVLLAKVTPCFENGKACVAQGVPNGLGAGTTELHIFRGFGKYVEPNYVLILFKSLRFIREGVASMTGVAGLKRIPADFMQHYLLPLPPLKDQLRIVDKVQQSLSLCDQLKMLT